MRRLQGEKGRLLRTEQEVSAYVLAEGEAAEPPACDYTAVRCMQSSSSRQVLIQKLPHTLNLLPSVRATSALLLGRLLLNSAGHAQMSLEKRWMAHEPARESTEWRCADMLSARLGAPLPSDSRRKNNDIAHTLLCLYDVSARYTKSKVVSSDAARCICLAQFGKG